MVAAHNKCEPKLGAYRAHQSQRALVGRRDMAAPGPHALLGNAAALVSTGSLIIAALTLRQADFATCGVNDEDCEQRQYLLSFLARRHAKNKQRKYGSWVAITSCARWIAS